MWCSWMGYVRVSGVLGKLGKLLVAIACLQWVDKGLGWVDWVHSAFCYRYTPFHEASVHTSIEQMTSLSFDERVRFCKSSHCMEPLFSSSMGGL
ncbi:hypothetical protein K504DRAFT_8972 [Pleomassaria siparia CBS 279.74]|uniref:Uncharacterized protein n=1 Tax=Pleomassaria siparia CBS 279.74 TaxID=1314801 RepID=A0A6G1KQY3_9PLEO|nr:hypothetical protein K504DRAFT_8972 [Pleomassaria siparia CBS 279.74]